MEKKNEQERFAELAPKLSDGELEAVNGLFRAFIFRRRSCGEYWTTCCRQHVVLDRARTVTPEMQAVMDAEHSPEPKPDTWTRPRLSVRCHDRIYCPHCGEQATVKELGRTGKRENLTGHRRALILKWHRGVLWAVGYQAMKSYYSPIGPLACLDELTALPTVKKTAVLRLRPGIVEMTERDWWYSQSRWSEISVQKEPRKKNLPFPVADPFTWNRDYGKGYDLIGWEELEKSPFRYIGIRDLVRKTGTEPLRLLAMACFFPRQMEMLHKFGLSACVGDFANQNKKNAWLLDWKTDDPKKFCRLPLKKALEAAGSEDGLEALRIWETNGRRDELEDCVWLAGRISDREKREWVRARARAWNIRLGRIIAYLSDNHLKGHANNATVQLWQDYIDAAEGLGLDLTNDIIRMPKDLKTAHDQRCAAWEEIQVQRRSEEEKKAYAERYKSLCSRYAFEADGLRIIVPKGSEDIIQEGKRLCHCVGGYAGRHLEGKTTILFLRRVGMPHTSLVTVEIDGARIRQAHGYKNEIFPCEDNPKQEPILQLYQDFFDDWLDWIKRGSPRNKDGTPKIKKKADGAAPSRLDERKISA